MSDLKIVITLDGKDHTLTREEAMALYMQLDELFAQPVTTTPFIPYSAPDWNWTPYKTTCTSDIPQFAKSDSVFGEPSMQGPGESMQETVAKLRAVKCDFSGARLL